MVYTFKKNKVGNLLMVFIVSLVPYLGKSQQTALDIVPPSPSASVFTKYGDIPVSLYTGVPNISVPIYTIQSRDITVPISLSYHASGIKVSEEAGRVGLGFALNSGGVISRTVVGRDDFSLTRSYHNGGIPELPYGPIDEPLSNLWNNCNLHFTISGDLNIPKGYFNRNGEVSYDFEPDQYTYNFLGYSGKFILTPNKEVILGEKEKIEITCLNDQATAWQIRTPDGTQYSFAVYETYKEPESISSPVKSSWYLTSIKSPTGEEVNFHYSTIKDLYIKALGGYIETQSGSFATLLPNQCNSGGNPKPSVSKPVPHKEYTYVQLDSINFTNGKVEFSYGAREDIEQDTKVESIKIFQKENGTVNTTPIKEFVFNYDYFISNGGANFNENNQHVYKRLKLLSVQEKVTKGGKISSIPPYQFKYYENTTLPAKSSFARDHWGYYNGKGGNTSLIPSFTTLTGSSGSVSQVIGIMGEERNTNSFYVKSNSLKEIIYPTGGSTEFQYETHDYDPVLSSANIEGQIGAQPTFYEKTKRLVYRAQYKGTIYEEELDLTDMWLNDKGEYRNTIVNAFFRVANDCSTINGLPDVYFELYRENGTRVSRVSMELPRCSATSETQCFVCDGIELKYTNEYRLPPGKYTWRAYIADNHNASDFLDIFTDYEYIADYKSLVDNGPKYKHAGGQRISKIITKDNINEANNKVKRFVYRYYEDKNNDTIPEEYSHGILMVQPRYSYFEEETKTVVTGEAAVPTITLCSFSYLYRSSNSIIPLSSSAKGNVIGYSNVTVLHGEEGMYGKTVYKYENRADRMYKYNMPSSVYSSGTVPIRPPFRSTLGYEKNGLLLNKTDYKKEGSIYKKIKETINEYTIPHTANHANLYYGIDLRRSNPQGQLASQCLEALVYPALQSNLVNLTSTIERTYDQNNENQYVENRVDYEYDYPNHLQLTKKTMTNSDGIISVEGYKYPLDYSPLERSPVITELVNRHIVNKVIEQTHSVNDTLVSAQANKYKHDIVSNIVVPETNKSLKSNIPINRYSYSQDGLVFNTGYVNDVTYHKYDIKGNVLEYSKNKSIHTVYLWGYNKTYPVAKIVNATYSEIEALPGFGASFDLGSAGLTSQQENTLRTAESLSNSRITTYTYEPLVGISSVTDPKGYKTTYVYDEFNRLKEIRDHQGNLVSDYKYHYKNNQ